MQKIISSPAYGKILQETIITQRDGRFVVPVKAEHRGGPCRVWSTTSPPPGRPSLWSPWGVVQANNEFIELQCQGAEGDRADPGGALRRGGPPTGGDIQWDYDTLVHLDLIFARGELSYKMNAVRPEIRRDGAIHLRKGPAPPCWIPKRRCPSTSSWGDTFDTLVITGPNTGGKTVTLKTAGPSHPDGPVRPPHPGGGDRSALSVYEHVLADIGDEQSIEQSLSTFSAHMVNIVGHFEEGGPARSLVLFDELGAGTDPVEGRGPGHLRHPACAEAGGPVWPATTHYAELKTFAMTTAAGWRTPPASSTWRPWRPPTGC